MKRIALILFSLAVLSACQRAAEPVAQGEAYFKAIGCAQCHRIGDQGGTWGPDLTTIGFRKSPEWLDTWLKDPHSWRKETVMPSFNLRPEARAALVAYLSTQKGQAWAQTGRPWNHPDVTDPVKKGEVLFERAGCVACHAQKGRGGYPNNNVVGNQIPSLAKVFEGYTKEELMTKIRGGVIPTPADPSAPAPMIQMPKWDEFLDDAEISAVADYLVSLGKGAAKKDDW